MTTPESGCQFTNATTGSRVNCAVTPKNPISLMIAICASFLAFPAAFILNHLDICDSLFNFVRQSERNYFNQNPKFRANLSHRRPAAFIVNHLDMDISLLARDAKAS